MKNYLTLGITFFISIFLLGAAGPIKHTQKEYTLMPSVTCTEMACSKDNPCCNQCQFQGWTEVETHVVAQSKKEALPACVPDGCGKCSFLLKAKGYLGQKNKQDIIYVKTWEKLENSLVVEPLPKIENAASEAERKEAIEKWMKDLKKQSDENMEKLRRENPEQYEKMQELMKALQGVTNSTEQTAP